MNQNSDNSENFLKVDNNSINLETNRTKDREDIQSNDSKRSVQKTASLTKSKKRLLNDCYLRSKGISVWMPLADTSLKLEEYSIIDILEPLQIINIYDNIDIFDNLFNKKNASNNCFTIRNDSFQKVFYAGSAHNRKLGKYVAFTLRLTDQYSRHILSIKKYFTCCLALHRIDIVFSDGKYSAKLEQIGHKDRTVELIITDPKSKYCKFSIKRLTDTRIKHKFDIFENDTIVGYFVKIFTEIQSKDFSEDNYIRISISKAMNSEDKALILSAALIINILFLRQIKRK